MCTILHGPRVHHVHVDQPAVIGARYVLAIRALGVPNVNATPIQYSPRDTESLGGRP